MNLFHSVITDKSLLEISCVRQSMVEHETADIVDAYSARKLCLLVGIVSHK
jgi:hypothetical protein